MNRPAPLVHIAVAAALASSLLASCGRSPATGGGPGVTRHAWMLDTPPENARGVIEVKASAVEGDAVVLHARIGGRRDPITAGSAVLVVVDPSIPSCADDPDDNCPTPWDYCCEPAESLTAGNATVQIVDAEGRTIVADLRAAGLSPLDELVVVGVVGPRPSQGVLNIMATGIHRIPR